MMRDSTHGSIETKDQTQLKDPAKTEDDDIRAFVILLSRKNQEVICRVRSQFSTSLSHSYVMSNLDQLCKVSLHVHDMFS